MGNWISKVPTGEKELFDRAVGDVLKLGNCRSILSFQGFQALAGRADFKNRVIVTPIGDRFPACACDLEYSLSENKFVYENASSSLR